MSLIITPESALGIELSKWNKPYQFKPWPRMLYRASRRPDGVISVGEAEDGLCGGQPGSAEAFSRRCQRVVENEQEMSRAMEDGWRETPQDALALFESREKSRATAAAHRAYEDRNMSEMARAEAAAAESATEEHVAEVPEAPRRRPGRPPKNPQQFS